MSALKNFFKMVLSFKSYLFVIFITTQHLVSFISAFPPNMEPNVPEIYINEGDPLRIKCSGFESMNFFYPVNVSMQYVTSPVEILQSNTTTGIQTITLTRDFTVHGDTGWYGCADFDVDPTPNIYNESDIKWTYVYVKSNTSWFVNSEEFESIREETGNSVILRCRPTSPNHKVILYDNEENEVNQNPRVFFDPKIGFTIKNIVLQDTGYFRCVIQIDDNEQMVNYHLLVIRKPKFLNQPKIMTNTLRHVVQGQTLKVKCIIDVDSDLPFTMHWNTPQQSSRISTSLDTKSRGTSTKIATIELTIKDVAYEDEGEYSCSIQTFSKNTTSKINITVHDPRYKYINLIPQNNEKLYRKNHSQSIQWVVNVDAHPIPKLKWLDPRSREITTDWNDPKRGVNTSFPTTILRINNLNVDDMGLYTLVASDTEKMETLNFTLEVMSKPLLDDFKNVESYYIPNSDIKVQCRATAFPLPNITWSFKELNTNDVSLPMQETGFKILTNVSTEVDMTKHLTTSSVTMKIETTGVLKAEACNILACDSISETLFVSDVLNGFGIIEPTSDFAEGDDLELICGASIYNYTNNIKWIDEQNRPIVETDRLHITKTSTLFTYRSILQIKNLQKSDSQLYVCRPTLLNTTNAEESIEYEYRLIVQDPKKPYFIYTENMNQTEIIYDLESAIDLSIDLKCYIEGMPKPTISWFKDDVLIDDTEDFYTFMNHNQELHIEPREKNSGKYLCKGVNRLGYIETYQIIKIKGGDVSSGLIISIIVLIIICVILVIYFGIKMQREKVMRKQLMEAGLTHFEEGAIECLNSDLTIDDQAELLPYDKKWEFPRERLKLGKQLGCGAFGVVMKAEAQGISDSEPITTVAVKMVRRSTEATYIRSLASELKIMVHLGKHLNVVNLLGACTKNIAKRELLVIVEYCRFGNLHNYLLRHRNDFINQIDPTTDKLDLSIGRELLARSVSMGSNNRIKYAALSFSRSISISSSNGPDTVSYTPGTEIQDVNTTEGPVLSNNSIQPGWRSNYRGDYKDYNLKPICTQDLLSWAFQVARGMEYLSQRKVLHGDLAARNILLAEDNIVKICDFGLAKTMYKDDNYKKKGDALLPIKWMAIESIRDRIFSTQSDIWSFGIVLWEFFTLAKTPYPGMEAEKQYQKLIEGYRMEKPDYATEQVYNIMLECWKAKPTVRPSFTQLVNSIGDLLDESVKMHYVDLNAPYLDMNTAFFENRKNDYLTMMSAPDHDNLSSPHTREYVNSPSIPINPCTDTSYMLMSSTTKQRDESGIFSPASINLEETRFNFPSTRDENKRINSDSDSEAVELSPMLKDEDDNYLKPINVHERRAEFVRQRAAMKQAVKDENMERDSGYCNTLQNLQFVDYHNEEVGDEIDGNKINDNKLNKNNSNGYTTGIIRTQDNYVNMPVNKNELNKDNPDCFTNPSYIFVSNDINNQVKI